MSKQTVWLEAQARNFSEIPNGVRWEAVIFSSEFNRNKYFFDIYKLLRWKGRLEKVLMNNNHNGKYFANSTDKIVDISVSTDENGVTECFAVIESTNDEKRSNPDMVTGFSIELRVDEKDVIANENGEYYTDYEWVGIAYLTGILAGSGDARILTTKTFQLNNNIMNEEQVKALLAEQKTELLAEFASQAETLKKEFAEKVVGKQQVKTDGMLSWIEDGVTYTGTWQNIYTEMLTALGKEEPEAPEVMEFLAKKFNYKGFGEIREVETQPEPEITPEVTPEAVESDELTKIEMSLNHAETLKQQMKQFTGEELVSEVAPAENATKSYKLPSFYSKINN